MVVGTLWSWVLICGWTSDVLAVVLAASVFGTVWLVLSISGWHCGCDLGCVCGCIGGCDWL